MSTIHVLDDSTINKIAAGEVVERPASVVKELVENSIDAGAKKIEVEIMAGGTSFLRVTDDGKGMTEEDARLAILRHATSKIREAADLQTIGTLGFRGEALPTIASVSRFSMKTRPQGADLGTEVVITGGKEPDIHAAGASLGTTIKVEDLFFNTPARKKFLKTNHTEAAHISDFITKLALSHPEIAFRFINNNKMALVTPGSGKLYDAIRAIYGKNVSDSLLALALENPDEGLRITGYITKPSMLKSTRGWQTFIVNGRIIQSRAIAKAIDNAYKSMVPKSGYPMAVLCLDVPPRTVDVNVHPQKSEMKFEDESLIFKAVYKATLDAVRPAQDLGLQRVAAVVDRPSVQMTQEPM
ncbi:MAG: DNA mismatch repair endonuclease MutL, partial [Selenomonas sp.]